MTTIKLKINDSILPEVLSALSKFHKNDVELISEKDDFESIKVELVTDLEKAEKEKAYSIEEADRILEDVISSYESRIK